MKLKPNLKLFLACCRAFSGDFHFRRHQYHDRWSPIASPAVSPAVTRDEMANNYLQIQEQIHATQLAIEQNQETALETSQSNSLALAERLQSLEQTVASQHNSDAEAARKTQQLTLLMAGAFGLVGLGVMLLMVYFQWRSFAQLAQISGRQQR